jgi:cAMP-dependent protein kinase regulator
MEVPKIKS